MGLFGKNWRNSVLLESEKEAILLAREEGLPDVNPGMSCYPVDVLLPKRRSLRGALKRCKEFSEKGLYSMVIRKS